MDIESIAKEYISIAESNYGEMCSDWKYGGVEINDGTPHLRYYPSEEEVRISLSKKVIGDEVQLHFQLAHEVCHLLYPTTSLSGFQEVVTVFNEGVSTYFSVWAAGRFCGQKFLINDLQAHNPTYFNAFMHVYNLLNIDHDAIKKLRAIQPKLNRIIYHNFFVANVEAPKELINQLLQDFR